jgi:hypothetical protein
MIPRTGNPNQLAATARNLERNIVNENLVGDGLRSRGD